MTRPTNQLVALAAVVLAGGLLASGGPGQVAAQSESAAAAISFEVAGIPAGWTELPDLAAAAASAA
ncbi:MAG: MFS transporter, partial [Myxococcota bacterium]